LLLGLPAVRCHVLRSANKFIIRFIRYDCRRKDESAGPGGSCTCSASRQRGILLLVIGYLLLHRIYTFLPHPIGPRAHSDPCGLSPPPSPLHFRGLRESPSESSTLESPSESSTLESPSESSTLAHPGDLQIGAFNMVLSTVHPAQMSVWSMGSASLGHARAGPGGPTHPLRHRRLRTTGSWKQAP
jgi:hypothetical protein